MGGVILSTSPKASEVRLQIQKICAAFAVAHPTLLKTVLFDTAADKTAAGSPTSGQLVSDCKLASTDLPALVAIYTTGAVPEPDQGGTRQTRHMTRDYHLLILWQMVEGAEIVYQVPAHAYVLTRVEELPDYFAAFVDRLKFNGSGLGNVSGLGSMSDQGSENPILWLNQAYAATEYVLPVTTLRR